MDTFLASWGSYAWAFFGFLFGAFLLGLLIGAWIWGEWGRWKSRYNSLLVDMDRLRARNTDLEKDLDAERYRVGELQKELTALKASLNKCEADRATLNAQLSRARANASTNMGGGVGIASTGGIEVGDKDINISDGGIGRGGVDLEGVNLQLTMLGETNDDILAIYQANGINSVEDLAATSEEDLASMFGDSKYNYSFAKRKADLIVAKDMSGFELVKFDNYALAFRSDNLQVVEGIGPKLESVLKEAGVTSWSKLSNKSRDELKAILNEAGGKRYQIHDPKTWPEQARLANEGKWEELVAYQKLLDTGRDTTGDGMTPAKVEKLMIKILGVTANPDDLKVVEGIGPKIEGLLKADGINTWSDLAASSVDRLKEILTKAGDRYKLAVPDTWPKQAELAAAKKWVELREYQDYLQGGKEPG
ncbi:MAG: helix-hairpin-helix domain-containing protein [Bacteroidota bacterium]